MPLTFVQIDQSFLFLGDSSDMDEFAFLSEAIENLVVLAKVNESEPIEA